jgi:hypothetical protein
MMMTTAEQAKLRYEIYEHAFYALNKKGADGEYVYPTFEQTKELAERIENWVMR